MGKTMFLRMNIVEVEPMTRGEHLKSKGLSLIPGSGKEEDEGYKVVYADGYVSWCPKDKFDAVSVSCAEGCVPFGYAIAECQYHGKKIKRAGWNGDGQYVRFEEVCVSHTGQIPTNLNELVGETNKCFVFHYKNRHTGETGVQVGWLASQADLQAKDWVILDE